jgi:glycosyltransferase involved in cell wall biosynthesis
LNVVHLGKWYTPVAGGIETVTAALARDRVRRGDRITVVAFGSETREEAVEGVRVLRCSTPLTVASQPLSVAYLLRAHKAIRDADIVHLHWPNFVAALAVVLCRDRTAPIVVHWHADVSGRPLLAAATRWLERAVVRRASRVLATSQAYLEASEALRGIVGSPRAGVVPIGLPDVTVRAQPLPSLPTTILAVGRLVKYKGFERLLAAMPLLPDVQLRLVGVGPLDGALRRAAKQLDVSDRVAFLGSLDASALTREFCSASLLCLPSSTRAEAFGVVLVESMRLGLPVVACRIAGSGVPWVVGEDIAGVLADASDAKSLACAIQKVLKDPGTRDAFGARARARYELLFTEQRMLDRVDRFYVSLLDRARGQLPVQMMKSQGD